MSTHISKTAGSKTVNRMYARTELLETSLAKQFIVSNQNTLEARQNETQLEDLPDGKEVVENCRNEEVVKVHSYYRLITVIILLPKCVEISETSWNHLCKRFKLILLFDYVYVFRT